MNRCAVPAALLVSQLAFADPRPRAAIAAIDVGPGVPAYVRERAAQQIADGLRAAGYDVVPDADVRDKAPELASCREGSCLTELATRLDSRAVVIATFTEKDESTIAVMRLFDGASATPLAEVHDVCDLCGESELDERVAVAASALRQKAMEHRQRAVVVVAPPPPPPPVAVAVPASSTRSIVPGIAVGVAGLAVLGAAAYALHLDGKGTCSPGDGPVYPDAGATIRYPDPADHSSYVCSELYHTRTLGLALGGVGALGVALGAFLVVRAFGGEHAVTVTPTAGGASVGASFRW